MADKIFPIIDRQTPVLDRIRNQDSDESIAFRLGMSLASVVKADEELSDIEIAEFDEEFIRGLSQGLDIDMSEVSSEPIERLNGLLELGEDDITPDETSDEDSKSSFSSE